ncbi:unnamed protein product [Cunninghamella blakesleeana]
MSVSTIDFEDDKLSVNSAPDLASEKLYGRNKDHIRITNKSEFLHFTDFQLEPLPFSLDTLNEHYQQQQQQQRLYKNVTMTHEQRTFALYLEPEENSSLALSLTEFQDRLFTRFGLNYTHSSAPHIALIPNIEIQRGNDTNHNNNNIKNKWETVDQVKDYVQQIMKEYQSILIPPSFNGYHIQSSSPSSLNKKKLNHNNNNKNKLSQSILGNKNKKHQNTSSSSPLHHYDRSVSLSLKMDPKYEKLCHLLQQKIKSSSLDNISISTSSSSSTITSIDRMLLAFYPYRNNISNNQNMPSRIVLKKIRDMARSTLDINDWVKNNTSWKITLYEVMLKSSTMVGIKEQLKKINSWSIDPSSKSRSFSLPVMLKINFSLMSSWFRVSPIALETKRIQAASTTTTTTTKNEESSLREQLVC